MQAPPGKLGLNDAEHSLEPVCTTLFPARTPFGLSLCVRGLCFAFSALKLLSLSLSLSSRRSDLRYELKSTYTPTETYVAHLWL